jgi:hypothetical protein
LVHLPFFPSQPTTIVRHLFDQISYQILTFE